MVFQKIHASVRMMAALARALLTLNIKCPESPNAKCETSDKGHGWSPTEQGYDCPCDCRVPADRVVHRPVGPHNLKGLHDVLEAKLQCALAASKVHTRAHIPRGCPLERQTWYPHAEDPELRCVTDDLPDDILPSFQSPLREPKTFERIVRVALERVNKKDSRRVI
jgi:hypothetical protein